MLFIFMQRRRVESRLPSASTIPRILTVVTQTLQQAKRIEQTKRYTPYVLGSTATQGE